MCWPAGARVPCGRERRVRWNALTGNYGVIMNGIENGHDHGYGRTASESLNQDLFVSTRYLKALA